MSKKITKIVQVLVSSKYLDETKLKLETKIYPDSDAVIYRFNCIEENFDLEMSLGSHGYEHNAAGILEFGQSFDNDYNDLTFKEFKSLLNIVNGKDVI